MLSLQRCREILGSHCQLTDEELEHLRDQMYGLAAVVVDQIGDTQANKSKTDQADPGSDADRYKSALKLLSVEDREEVEERAAIIEFEGKVDKDQAERKAILSLVGRHRETK